PGGTADIGVGRENPVNLDTDLTDSRTPHQQACERRAGNRGGCCESKIVSRLDLKLASAFRAGCACHRIERGLGAEQQIGRRRCGGEQSQQGRRAGSLYRIGWHWVLHSLCKLWLGKVCATRRFLRKIKDISDPLEITLG